MSENKNNNFSKTYTGRTNYKLKIQSFRKNLASNFHDGCGFGVFLQNEITSDDILL